MNNEETEKNEKVPPVKKGYVKKGNNGGKRKGSGRKPDVKKADLETIKDEISNFGMEQIDVKTTDGKIVKKRRILVVLNQLFVQATNGDTPAAKEFLDRQMGKAPQSIDVNGTLKVEKLYEINSKTDELLKRAAEKRRGPGKPDEGADKK